MTLYTSVFSPTGGGNLIDDNILFWITSLFLTLFFWCLPVLAVCYVSFLRARVWAERNTAALSLNCEQADIYPETLAIDSFSTRTQKRLRSSRYGENVDTQLDTVTLLYSSDF